MKDWVSRKKQKCKCKHITQISESSYVYDSYQNISNVSVYEHNTQHKLETSEWFISILRK